MCVRWFLALSPRPPAVHDGSCSSQTLRPPLAAVVGGAVPGLHFPSRPARPGSLLSLAGCQCLRRTFFFLSGRRNTRRHPAHPREPTPALDPGEESRNRWNLHRAEERGAEELQTRSAAPEPQSPAMITAAPLYSGVHNWSSTDRVRMCGINDDRRTPVSDEKSKSGGTHLLGSEDRCVNSVLSKVDFIPATNQSDALMLQEGGGAEVETGQQLEEKPPDPTSSRPAGAALSFKACDNVSPPDGKQAASMLLDASIQAASSKHGKKMEYARTPAQEKEHPALQPAASDPSVKQKTVMGPGLQIAGQPVEASHAVVSSSFGTLTPFTMSRICFSATQVPNMQKLPLSFTSGTVITPTQPLVYIPPSNCVQPLSVTTLPTTFGVTSTLTLPIMPSCLQDRCLLQASSELHTHAFASSLGRPLNTDPKVISKELNKPVSTAPSVSLTNSNSIITSSVDGSSVCTEPSSSTLSALQTLSTHPTLPMVSMSPVTLTTYSRTPNVELQNDSSSVSPLKSPPQLEREMVSPPDSYEMPLDLSSKSHRHKHAPSNQRKTPPMPVLTPVHTSGRASLSTVVSRSDCSSQRPAQNSFTSSSVSQSVQGGPPLVMFPEFLRNGDPVSSQLVGASGSWIKNSAALISTIPGTYVGVANPVPASVLLNKDSNLSLSTDSQLLAKQEPISIIDQGEPKNSGSCGKKSIQASVDGKESTEKRHLHGRASTVNSLCPSKDWTLSGHGTVHPKCPLNGKPSNSQVLPVSWSHYRQPSLLSIGTLRSSQGPPHRLPIGEYTLFSSILPAESNVTPQKSVSDSPFTAQQQNAAPTAAAAEHDVRGKSRTCESLSKPRKPRANKALLAPKPAAGNPVLYLQPGAVDGQREVEGSTTLNKVPDKQNCKDDKIRPKLTCSRKTFGDTKPKNKVLASYMTSDQLTASQPKDAGHGFPLLGVQDCSKKDSNTDVSQDQPAHRKRSHKKTPPVDALHCVQEVDLSKVKIERVDDDENFGCLPSYNNSSWSPVDMPPITKVKARVKKEPGLRGRYKRLEEVTPIRPAQPKPKCKRKQQDVDKNLQEPQQRKWKRQSAVTSPEKKERKAAKPKKEPVPIRTKRRKRMTIKAEPYDPEYELATPERKPKKSFRDFIPVVLKSRTRSQTGTIGFSDLGNTGAESEDEEEEEATGPLCKRRKLRKAYKSRRPRRFAAVKEEPEPEPISPTLQDPWELSSRGLYNGKSSVLSEQDGEEDGLLRPRKRRRQKNRKYQNGEYLTEKEEEEVSQCRRRRRSRADLGKRKLSPDRADETVKGKRSQRRNGSSKGGPGDSPSAQTPEKPAGKRKCKTKHLGGGNDEEMKGKGRRSTQSPKGTPVKSPSPRKGADPGTPCRSRRTSTLGSCDTPSAQHIPPEARRLIVNKNAGETLLQRAARLGYKDVVLYCLQRDLGDINHRDNAGYTALHEACARGWTEILQILLDNGANVNCSAQDGTRPIHDAVVNDNLETVWLLLSYGADPTLATYSGQTAMKLASSEAMRTFLSDYLSDLRGRSDGDPRASWDFYSSSVLGAKDEIGHDILLGPAEAPEEEEGEKDQEDHFTFEFSDAPLISCYNLHVSLTSGPSNWFLISDVLKKLKLSSRIFQARFPNFEIASVQKKEFTRQVFTSQILTPAEGTDLWPQDSGETVELIKYEPELLRLLGSSVESQSVNS
ncbi:BCL-6 corepressor-like protein 1 isoform X2 [Mixophyes fleayi]|uniref:BCL-6 corepressor-like protein 1 isoform X2 n=1 Tax=Mixophyes fleayi TaxID=3061075 RepID=UPI003F4DC3C0